MKTKVLSQRETLEEIIKGAGILAQAVGTSLGPRGMNVGISRTTPTGEVYERLSLHDGVSIARAIDLKNEAQNFGVAVLREAASKTVDTAGDGTSVTIVLAHAILTEGEKQVAAGINPMSFTKELQKDVDEAIKLLKKQSIPVTTLEQKIQIATISSEEESLGKLIGETIHKVGLDGIVTVDVSRNDETMVEHQDGMNWDKGFASPYMVTDPDTFSATIEDGLVLVTDHELTNIQELLPLLEAIVKTTSFFTIIAPEFGGNVLPSLIQNKLQGKFVSLCLKAPSFGAQQTAMLGDIAVLTGATFISKESGMTWDKVTLAHLGKAERVAATRFSSMIRGGNGTKELIDSRIEEVRSLIDSAMSEFERQQYKERLAKLTAGVSVIKVGGITEVEMKERYERALDAVLSTRKAVEGGIVAGGETAYLSLIPHMKSPILQLAFEAPFKKLMENANYDGGQILERLAKRHPAEGFDVIDGKIKNMIGAGIIDPVAVPIAAITNGVSVALKLLQTKIQVLPEEKDEK